MIFTEHRNILIRHEIDSGQIINKNDLVSLDSLSGKIKKGIINTGNVIGIAQENGSENSFIYIATSGSVDITPLMIPGELCYSNDIGEIFTSSNALINNAFFYVGICLSIRSIKIDLAPQPSLYGRLPLGTVVPIIGTFTEENNGGTNISPTNIPISGEISLDGFQLCDGVAVGNGASLTGFVPKINDDRFIQGSSSAGITGGNVNNSKTLSINEMPIHDHTITDLGHNHTSETPVPLYSVDSDRGIGNSSAFSIDDTTYPSINNNTTGITINNNGGSQSFDIRPQFISGIYMMRVK